MTRTLYNAFFPREPLMGSPGPEPSACAWINAHNLLLNRGFAGDTEAAARLSGAAVSRNSSKGFMNTRIKSVFGWNRRKEPPGEILSVGSFYIGKCKLQIWTLPIYRQGRQRDGRSVTECFHVESICEAGVLGNIKWIVTQDSLN